MFQRKTHPRLKKTSCLRVCEEHGVGFGGSGCTPPATHDLTRQRSSMGVGSSKRTMDSLEAKGEKNSRDTRRHWKDSAGREIEPYIVPIPS